jgi:hypothetical protein
MRGKAILAGGAVAAVLAAAVAGASGSDDTQISGVPTANTKAVGYAPALKLAPELQQVAWAQGSTKLENPQGVFGFYGYEKDVPSGSDPSVPQMVPTGAIQNEAAKTEPDKNTYLVFKHGLKGGDASYDYGTHFLYQGHEKGAAGPTASGQLGYITRINLDANAEHRVTLMATTDNHGQPLATIDGSTWDPFAQRLLFTTEGQSAPTYAATADYPSVVEDVSGALGRGGYEGIQNDQAGNLYIVEDIGGATKAGSTKAKLPNSFVYRYVPRSPGDLHNGKLQALQALNEGGTPITFTSESTFPSPDQIALHTYGKSFTTRWVTVHDTAVDGTASFNANVAAKAANATPFKRPENGMFRPGTGFREFYFDETGDTDATSSENGDPNTAAGGAGGWGSVMKLTLDPSGAGKLTMFYAGNQAHSGFDNVTFLSKSQVTFVEDAGDTLHSQRNALDSGYVFDVTRDYSTGLQPTRWLAQGRDPSATIDSAAGGFGKNDGDNEITGVIVSNGDPTASGILGAQVPHLFQGGWRWFWTQQHGDNITSEVIPVQTAQGDGNSNSQN